jgi:hypothetical protein
MSNLPDLIETLEAAIGEVEAGRKSADCCCTLVAPSMKGTGIRPEMVSEAVSGERVYLLTAKQARKLRERAVEALEAKAREEDDNGESY